MDFRRAVAAATSDKAQAAGLAQKWHDTVNDAQKQKRAFDNEHKSRNDACKIALLPFTQSAQLSLAALFRSRGDHSSALPIYEKCLEERRRLLGVGHPETLLISNAAAYTLHLNGEHERALPLLEESLEIWREMFGNEHPNTILYVTPPSPVGSR
jgi:hypothetical protein